MTRPHGVKAVNNTEGQQSYQLQSTFEVLAEGTQDLAALVGLFATDAVERYAVDYSRGYLSVAMATCSLLGLLGYVRALVKLAMGSESCQNSAFPTAPVRPILGVAEVDRLPKEEMVMVKYITVTSDQESMKFEIVKNVYHTEESFPLAKQLPRAMHMKNSPQPTIYLVNGQDSDRSPWRSWVLCPLTAAVTTFPVLLFPHLWTWTRIVASFGLFIGLAVPSIMWSHVYHIEQRPGRNLAWDDHSSPTCDHLDTGNVCYTKLHEARIPLGWENECGSTYFTIIQPATQARSHILVLCDLKAVPRWPGIVCRVVSMGMGVLICVGYLCQYVEVRRANTIAAAWWLGIQIGLALLRLLIWIWDLSFDNFNDPDVKRYDLPHKCWAISYFSSLPEYPTQNITVPRLIISHLDYPGRLLRNTYHIASAGSLTNQLRDDLLNSYKVVWKFPDYHFSRWIGYLSMNADIILYPSGKYTCVVATKQHTSSEDSIIIVPLIGGPKNYRVAYKQTTVGGIGYDDENNLFHAADMKPLDEDQSNDVQLLIQGLEGAMKNLRVEADASQEVPWPVSPGTEYPPVET
ncbi:hypothetical protein BDZ91DRAFT_766515 [Kalaharituber pfeilii]|nr:hypothetical protein BDZ91DRAFT_766515 [Kalaharituber pfeilii]